jgi:hypothetical protein
MHLAIFIVCPLHSVSFANNVVMVQIENTQFSFLKENFMINAQTIIFVASIGWTKTQKHRGINCVKLSP